MDADTPTVDHACSMVVGQQPAPGPPGSPSWEHDRAGAEVLHAVQARCMAVGEGRDDDVRAAGQRLLRHLGGIADDEVGPVARGEQGVGPRTDPDQPGPVLPDEPPQPGQAGDVVVAGRDDEHLAICQVHLHVGNPDPVEEHPALPPHELDRVGSERLQLVGQPRLGLDERVGHRVRGLRDALGEHLLPGVEHPFVHTHPDAVLDRVQDLGTDRVDQRDPGVDEDRGPKLGKRPGSRGGVDDRHDLRGDQRVGGRPVEIDLIEHRDVARPQPP